MSVRESLTGVLIDMEWDVQQERSYGVLYPYRRLEFGFRISPTWLGAELRVSGTIQDRRTHRLLVVSDACCLRTQDDLVLSVPRSQEARGAQRGGTEGASVAALLALPLRWLCAGGMKGVRRRLREVSMQRAEQVLRNPYSAVISRTWNFGVADCLHHLLGGARVSRHRVQAGLRMVFARAVEQGWVGLHRSSVCSFVAARLCVTPAALGEIEQYIDTTYCLDAGGMVYCRSVYRQVAAVQNEFGQNQMALTSQSDDVAAVLLSRRFSVVVGSAGSGKTRLLQEVVVEAARRGLSVALTALTGKAASVLGHDGCTLHRLLGFGPHGFARKRLHYDLIIVDEAPMLTLKVLWELLQVSGHAIVIFAGDVKQLGPVSGIAVYRDIVRQLPKVDLDQQPAIWACPIGPVQRVRIRRVCDVTLFVERTLRRWNDAQVNWQVISPVYESVLGVRALNHLIQELINPHGEPVGAGFRLGDRVMVTKNVYTGERSLCNGEVGIIAARRGGMLVVQIGQHSGVLVPWRYLELAYCLTVHKVQGSRFARVVVILPERSFPRFCHDRQLLEVAESRATEQTLCVVT